MHPKTLLKQYGLTDEQVRIYMSLLKLVEASAYKVSKETKIPKATCYDILERLKDKGLVTIYRKKKVKMYVPESPRTLLTHFERKYVFFKNNISLLDALVDKAGAKPTVRFYEGVSYAQDLFDHHLHSGEKKVFYISESYDVMDLLGSTYYEYFSKERINKGMYVYGIWPYLSSETKNLKVIQAHRSKQQLRDIRVAPKDVDIVMTMILYGPYTSFLSSKKEGYGLLIESKEYARFMKTYWNLLWNVSHAR